ncbi:N-acetyl-gamma-glutamyl-phosphate reductase [Lederbergia citrea]|uniref:N-acetyl-gamma-glutamyl-phosphate reductase n=1 Tax=Lederbergia citrea TaxID=2833581 RepID=UPI001BC9087C|nr:N-acetyl-gamma-glutamyl-phosphate reductase [Lederbergia citrea]MBS4203477.1 N-acetyl-gamma-glutamyl-phosphate reductase [Lederbergia citrea]
MKAGIVGATGYGGAELLRILHSHPEFQIGALYTSSQQGEAIQNHYPHLTENFPQVLEEINPVQMAKEMDVIFLAVPSGIASKLAPQILDEGCAVVDLSGDFRLKNSADYEDWYHKKAGPEEWIEKAVYSLPELNRASIKGARFISNPGCYPTATLLGLAPLIKEELLVEGSIIVDAKSGVSGAGQSPSLSTIYSELNENLKIYKVNEHQHIPEIEQMLKIMGYSSPITFQTHLVPMTRGIMATIYGSIKTNITENDLWNLYAEYYRDEPFVRVRGKGNFPATKEVAASNYCDIGVAFDERTKRATIVSVIDNLMKGAAGQAIQNANIMFGFDETTGLNFSPVYP